MPEHSEGRPAPQARWRDELAIVNLRGRPDDAAFLEAARAALSMALPVQPCRTVEASARRIIWAGPDDWFVLDSAVRSEVLVGRLREALDASDAAVTDVSSGYALLCLSGASAREVLARGCPLDLHPRAFGVGRSAGSHFFKASVWIWQTDGLPVFEMLVRRSLKGYVQLLLERSVSAGGRIAPRNGPTGSGLEAPG